MQPSTSDPEQQDKDKIISPGKARELEDWPVRQPTYDRPGNAPSTPPAQKSLADAEESGGQLQTRDSKPYSNQTAPGKIAYRSGVPPSEQSLYNSSATKPGKVSFGTFFGTRRRKIIFGAGGIGTIGGVVFFFTVLSGPFQFIHIAQLLQQFHFSSHQDAADDRFTKVVRYIRYRQTGQIEKTRLGFMANKYADRIEGNLNKSGIKTAYTKHFGFFDGYVIDPEIFADGEFAKDKNGLKSYLKDSYGVNTTEIDGKVAISSERVGLFAGKSRGLVRSMLREAGYSYISGAIQGRIMGKRAGITWHPIKRLDNKIFKTVDDRLTQWRKNRIQETKNGVNAPDYAKDTSGASEKGQQAAQEAADETQRTATEGQSTSEAVKSGDPGAMEKFKASTHFKITSGAAGAAGVLCLAKGVASDAENVKQAQVVLPLMRMGMEAITVGNQVMSGQDVDLEQLGFYSKQLNDKSGSWVSAASIQGEMGQKQTGQEADGTLKTIYKGTPFDFLDSSAIGPALNAICSTVGQGVQLVIGFLGGPVSLLTQAAVAAVVVPQVEDTLVRWLAGQAVDPTVTGAAYGNYINYGARLAANDQAIAAGGRELSNQETAALKHTEGVASQADFKGRSLAYKLFNPYDSRSAVSRVLDQGSPSVSQNFAKIANAFLGIPRSLAKLPNLLSGTVNAAATSSYDYGFPAYGFSQDELNRNELKNPFENASIVVNTILPGPNGQTYIERAHDCFGVDIDAASNYDVDAANSEVPKRKDISSSGCTDTNLDWLRVRFYIFDTQVMGSIACYEGDDQSCIEAGFDTIELSNPSSPTEIVSGNSQELAQKILNLEVAQKITFTTPLARQAIVDTSNGQPAKIEARCTNAGRSSAPLSSVLLGAIITIAQSHKLALGYFTNGCHGDGSAHYEGRAVDINQVDGRSSTGGNRDRPFMHEITGILPDGSGMGEVQCSSISINPINSVSLFADSCDHIHIHVPTGAP